MFTCRVGGMESLLNFERQYETQLISSKEHRGGGTWGTSFRVRHGRDCWYHACTDRNISPITSGPGERSWGPCWLEFQAINLAAVTVCAPWLCSISFQL